MASTRPTFRVFVCSSFRDLKIERDVLQNRVFPELRQFCETKGARFQAIDLRWGISEEASENQQTMNICLEELYRCQRITPRPNFIILLGDRYGWQPLPAQIFEDEFQLLLDALRTAGAEEDESLLTAWYRLDKNSVPRELVLRPRTDDFDENPLRSALQLAANGAFPPPRQISEEEFQQLLTALESSRSRRDRELLESCYRFDKQTVPQQRVLQSQNDDFNVGSLCRALQRAEDATQRARDPKHPPGERWKYVDPRRDKYFDSATHQEIRHGALQAEDATEHVFCYFRNIDPQQLRAEGVPITKEYKDYFDLKPDGTWDRPAHDRLHGLKDELCQRFGDHVREYNVSSFDDTEWHQQMAKDIVNDLRGVIEDALKKLEDDTDPELAEADPHVRFGQERSQQFTGRDDELDRIAAYVDDRDKRQPLVISGLGGSGKTALMAEAATRLGAAHESAVLISRYIGATPASSDVRSLLQSLCQEIRRHYTGESSDAQQGADSSTDTASASSEYQELVREFEQCLGLATEAKPLVMVLDALDQLNPTEGAQYLGWIPWRELPEHGKVIVSVLKPGSDDGNEDDPAWVSYRVATSRVPEEENIIPLGSMSRYQASQLLDKWLDIAGRRLSPWEYPDKNAGSDGIRRAGRTLTAEQRNDVLDKFAQPENGLPLWLKLAFEEVRHWKSYDGLPSGHTGLPGLSDNIADILGDLFARLQRPDNHGELFPRRAMGFLGAGRRGLTEDELLDVLSSDNGVMDDFITRSLTEKEKDAALRLGKLPVLIWSRLYSDLEPYLTERAAFGATVLSFYHRHVAGEVRKRCCAGDDEIHAHKLLAKYFGDHDARPYFLESLEEQRARARRLPPTPRPVNIRKVDELPYHVLQVAKLVGKDDPKAKEWDAVADLLTDWQFLEAKAEAQP